MKFWILGNNPEKKQEEKDVLENLHNFFEGRERVLSAFNSEIFPVKIEGGGFSGKVSDHSNLKILIPEQMLHRLAKALAQVNAGNNLSIMIDVNKKENRITFKIKTGYYIELLTSETMKLLGSNQSKISKDENGENVSHLWITEVILVHCNIVNNNYNNWRVLYRFVPNKSFVQLLDISPKNFVFLKTF